MLLVSRLSPWGLLPALLLVVGCGGTQPAQQATVPHHAAVQQSVEPVCAPVPADPAAGPVKRALIVGVSRYADTGHGTLHTELDVQLIREALTLHGFTDFTVLQNEEATYAGIKAAFDCMVTRSGEGDVVVFHYSGHGVQITDGLFDTNPGDEFDGYDESLLPHDAPFVSLQTPDEVRMAALADVRHLRDDEIHTFLEALRGKLGPAGNVALWVDACYSGSTAANVSITMFVGPDADSLNALEMERADRVSAMNAEVSRGEWAIGDPAQVRPAPGTAAGDPLEAPLPAEATAKAPLVVFSSSRHNQKSYEAKLPDGTRVGRFSYALHQVLSTADTLLTYQALFDRMQARMADLGLNQQTPQLEGNEQLLLFSSKAAPSITPHYTPARVSGDTLVQMEGGTLLGLSDGTRMAFYPIGTAHPTPDLTPLATGTVQDASGAALTGRVDVRLDAPVDPARLKQTWAFVTRHQLAGLKLRTMLAPTLYDADSLAVRAALEPLGFVEVMEAEGVYYDLVIDKEVDGLVVQTPPWARPFRKRVPLPQDRVTARAAQAVAGHILDYSRVLHLERIVQTQDNTAVDVHLSVVPPAEAPPGRCTFADDQQNARQQGLAWFMKPNDGFMLKLENKGPATVFFAVLALEPDGRVTQLYPRDPEAALDAVTLKAGSSAVLKECYEAGPLAGTRTLKVFASRKVPLNFEPILSRNPPEAPPPPAPAEGGAPAVEMLQVNMLLAPLVTLEGDLNTHAVTLVVR